MKKATTVRCTNPIRSRRRGFNEICDAMSQQAGCELGILFTTRTDGRRHGLSLLLWAALPTLSLCAAAALDASRAAPHPSVTHAIFKVT